MDITSLFYAENEDALHPVGDDKEGNEIFRISLSNASPAVLRSLKPGQRVKWRWQDQMARFELWYMGEVRGLLPDELTVVGKIVPRDES